MEIALEVSGPSFNITPIVLFQSLFYWKLLWKRIFCSFLGSKSKVSILVLLEIALEVILAQIIIDVKLVSILVLLEIALEVIYLSMYSVTTHVSILVLLEIALEVIGLEALMKPIFRFNPCSIGNCSGSC